MEVCSSNIAGSPLHPHRRPLSLFPPHFAFCAMHFKLWKCKDRRACKCTKVGRVLQTALKVKRTPLRSPEGDGLPSVLGRFFTARTSSFERPVAVSARGSTLPDRPATNETLRLCLCNQCLSSFRPRHGMGWDGLMMSAPACLPARLSPPFELMPPILSSLSFRPSPSFLVRCQLEC